MPQLIYVDSSVALASVMRVPQRSAVLSWIDRLHATLVSSRLLRTEVVRTLRRDKIPLTEAAPILHRVGLVDITHETHEVAERIERHTKTLDALHLATALLIGDDITVATHDKNMAAVATDLGLDAVDPVG